MSDSTAMVPYQDMERMANAIAKSGLFGMKTPEQALALMCVAQAEGRHPGSVAVEYHIIQGRPTLKADTMLARFQQAGGKVAWDQYNDTTVSAVFSHPQGGSIKVEWDMERAKKAGLGGKDVWKAYPRQMLRARVISEGVRTVYPGVAIGIYTPEEVQDFDEPKAGTVTVDNSTGEVQQARKQRKAKDVVQAEQPTDTLQADLDKMISAFKSLAIGTDTLEFFFKKPRAKWTADELAAGREIYREKLEEAKLPAEGAVI